MKYLKPFYENKGSSKEELQDLCEGSFAYLLDEGFVVNVYIKTDIKLIKISKRKEGSPIFVKFIWDEVKDYFIPFIQRLLSTEELVTDIDIDTGIVFKYIKPKHISLTRSSNAWYMNVSEYETENYQPDVQKIINDEILNDPTTIYGDAKCMNHIYEINILLKL